MGASPKCIKLAYTRNTATSYDFLRLVDGTNFGTVLAYGANLRSENKKIIPSTKRVRFERSIRTSEISRSSTAITSVLGQRVGTCCKGCYCMFVIRPVTVWDLCHMIAVARIVIPRAIVLMILTSISDHFLSANRRCALHVEQYPKF